MDEKPIKRRKRTSLVCRPCRKRKIKCDKGQPCVHCVKSKTIEACIYDPEALEILEKNIRIMPYMQSAKNPIILDRFQINDGADKSLNSTSNESKSELDFLKERLQYLESKVLESAPKTPLSKTNDNEIDKQKLLDGVVPLNYKGTKAPFTLPPSARNAKSDFKFSEGLHGFSVNDIYTIPMPKIITGNNSSPNIPDVSPMIPKISQIYGQPLQRPLFDQVPHQSKSLPSLNFPQYFHSDVEYPPSLADLSKDQTIRSENTSNTTVIDSELHDNVAVPKPQFKIGLKNDCMCGVNPYQSADDTINFFQGYSSVFVKQGSNRVAFGPFAWASLMRKDPALKLLWDHSSRMKESNVKTALFFINNKEQDVSIEDTDVLTTQNVDEESIDLDETVFKKRLLQAEGVGDQMPYYKLIKKQVAQKLEKASNNQNTLPLGLTYVDSKLDMELRLIDKIQLFLPKRKVVWTLIGIYFTDLFPFMPFLIEKNFRKEISRILGPPAYTDEKIDKINIEKRLDFAHIGLLLILLRLSYLSLFTNRNEINERRLKMDIDSKETLQYKYLLSNPVSMNIIDISQECLDQFNVYRQPSVPIFQLAFYMKFYHYYAPEDGDGADGGDSFTSLAVIISMAKSLGFHRDPSTIEGVTGTCKPANTIIRRMWSYLILNDIHEACTFGNNLKINDSDYDTKPPFDIDDEQTSLGNSMDTFINESLRRSIHLYKELTPLLRSILDIRGETKMGILCPLLSKFETLMYQNYGTLNNCIKLDDSKYSQFSRTFNTKFYIANKGFLLTMYFHLYLYYETTNIRFSFFYIRKLLMVCVDDIMPHYFTLIGNIQCDLIINPTFEQFIHKTNHIFFSLIIRINLLIYDMQIKPEHEAKCARDIQYLRFFKSLCKASSSVTRCLEVSIAVISKISNRYYYAWRITKGHTSLLRLVTQRKFYEEIHHKAGSLSKPSYDVEQIDELVAICERTLNRLGKADKNVVFNPEFFSEQTTSHSIGTPEYSATPPGEPENATPFNPLTPMSNFTFKPTTLGGQSVDHQHKQDNTNVDITEGFNLDCVNNSEIDNLWLQLLSTKNELNGDLANDVNQLMLDNSIFLNS